MTNLTLTVDEDILRMARIKALELGTSVNALVREYLRQLAGRSTAAEGGSGVLRGDQGQRGRERPRGPVVVKGRTV